MTTQAELLLPAGGAGVPHGCPNCVQRVANALLRQRGIQQVEVENNPPRLRYQFESDETSPTQVEEWVERELAANEDRYVHTVLAIEGMDCADCARTLERGVTRLTGVEHAAVNFSAARMEVEYDRGAIALPAIDRRIRELGYAITQPEDAPIGERAALARLLARRDNALALASGAFTTFGIGATLASAPGWLPVVSYAAAVAVGGAPLALKGIRSLRATRSLDINLLMTIAVIGAVAIGDWLEAATVVFLFSLGEALEGYAMDRVRRSVRSLLSLAPSVALVRRGEHERELPVTEVEPGDLVVVRAGERVPLDGVVVTGVSSVDQASLTGESLPVAKEAGDAIFAGTMNGTGPLTMRVSRLAGDSSVARIIRMVETAQAQRAPVQQLVDRFARYYTPAVILGAIAIAVVPPLLGGDWLEWFSRALVLLVISCPCALVLSTPISIVSALSAAARHGILIKGGATLERAGSVDTVAFDKTGTLTAGEPRVTQVIPLNGIDERGALALAATLERHSEHPLGRAIVLEASERAISVGETFDERVIPGAGLVATVDGRELRIGSRRLFDDAILTSAVHSAVDGIEREGGTAILLGDAEGVDAVIGLADTERPLAAGALRDLRGAGVRKLVMLSGDRPAAVERIAASVGVDDARAELLPEDKLAAIFDLRARGHVVAMVGDGVNDAPSLAAADLGVAMGVAGTDAAIETADVTLMGDDLRGLAQTVRLGRRTRRTVATNIAISIVTKLIFLSLAIAGMASLWMAILADVGVSLVVIANGLRLLRWPRS